MLALTYILAVLKHCAHQQITVIDKTLKNITYNSLDEDRCINNIPGEQHNYSSNDQGSYYTSDKLSSIKVIKMTPRQQQQFNDGPLFVDKEG
eukprot:6775884-Pyramimonas_sp.AAC.1